MLRRPEEIQPGDAAARLPSRHHARQPLVRPSISADRPRYLLRAGQRPGACRHVHILPHRWARPTVPEVPLVIVGNNFYILSAPFLLYP